MTDYPTSTEPGAIWFTGAQLNQIAQAGNERTVVVAGNWQRVLRLTPRNGVMELDMDVDQLLALYGREVGMCLDGSPVRVRILHSEPVAVQDS